MPTITLIIYSIILCLLSEYKATTSIKIGEKESGIERDWITMVSGYNAESAEKNESCNYWDGRTLRRNETLLVNVTRCY